jgi:hypothetical protein
MTHARQWEYIVETVGSAFKGIADEELSIYLNDLGRVGWEIFSVLQLENSVKIRVVGKRPVGQAALKHKQGWP